MGAPSTEPPGGVTLKIGPVRLMHGDAQRGAFKGLGRLSLDRNGTSACEPANGWQELSASIHELYVHTRSGTMRFDVQLQETEGWDGPVGVYTVITGFLPDNRTSFCMAITE